MNALRAFFFYGAGWVLLAGDGVPYNAILGCPVGKFRYFFPWDSLFYFFMEISTAIFFVVEQNAKIVPPQRQFSIFMEPHRCAIAPLLHETGQPYHYATTQ